MNQATISEEFGEQIAAITAGTKYEISIDSDHDVPAIETRIRNSMYCLWMDATAKELAEYLRRSAKQYFANLYEFSYGVSKYDADASINMGAERIALMIVAEKENRKRQIERLEKAYTRFGSIMDKLPPQDEEVLQQYFVKRKKIDYELLRGVVKKHLRSIEAIYDADTTTAEQRTKEISAEIEGAAPMMKRVSAQQVEKNRRRALKQLNNLFSR